MLAITSIICSAHLVDRALLELCGFSAGDTTEVDCALYLCSDIRNMQMKQRADFMVTFIIGNGFDLRVGLNTRYTDFYKVYTKFKNGDSKTIKRFKEEILKSESHNWKNWSDFERQMGIHSNEFQGDTPVEDFIECFNDFVVSFNGYLAEECENIDWQSLNTATIQNFMHSITSFYTHITRVGHGEVQSRIGVRKAVNFLQFNYTDAFDKLLDKSNLKNLKNTIPSGHVGIGSLGKNLHIHGKLGKGGYMTMGVDEEKQIKNAKMSNDPRMQMLFIKPMFLDALQARNVNREIMREEALRQITSSSVICSYGSSIGDTDGYWWLKIGDWLKNSHGTFIIFDVCGAEDDGISPLAFLNSELSIDDRKKEITERFLRLAMLNEDWVNMNPNRLIIELDTKMFNFKLPRLKTAQTGDQ